MIHLTIIVVAVVLIAYAGLVALDVVMSLFEQSKLFGFLALIAVIFAAKAVVAHFL